MLPVLGRDDDTLGGILGPTRGGNESPLGGEGLTLLATEGKLTVSKKVTNPYLEEGVSEEVAGEVEGGSTTFAGLTVKFFVSFTRAAGFLLPDSCCNQC